MLGGERSEYNGLYLKCLKNEVKNEVNETEGRIFTSPKEGHGNYFNLWVGLIWEAIQYRDTVVS